MRQELLLKGGILHIDVGELASRSRRGDVVEARRLIVTVGREHSAQSSKQLASALQKSADTVTSIQREGVRQRLDDRAFSRRYESPDAALVDGRM